MVISILLITKLAFLINIHAWFSIFGLLIFFVLSCCSMNPRVHEASLISGSCCLNPRVREAPRESSVRPRAYLARRFRGETAESPRACILFFCFPEYWILAVPSVFLLGSHPKWLSGLLPFGSVWRCSRGTPSLQNSSPKTRFSVKVVLARAYIYIIYIYIYIYIYIICILCVKQNSPEVFFMCFWGPFF